MRRQPDLDLGSVVKSVGAAVHHGNNLAAGHRASGEGGEVVGDDPAGPAGSAAVGDIGEASGQGVDETDVVPGDG